MYHNVYRGDLKRKEDLLNYDPDVTMKKDLWDAMKVIYARVEEEDYRGRMWVVYLVGDQLYEVYSTHCSCSGFDWIPEPVTMDAILWRNKIEDEWLKDFVKSVLDRE
jgi:hypothetical protein